MEKINRKEAVSRITSNMLEALDTQSREAYILDWWGIGEDDEEFPLLSNELQKEILLNEDSPDDVNNKKYDQLIKVALCFDYRGVTNIYIAETMATMGLGQYKVYGDVEKLETCPCCGFQTLSSRGDYEICKLCDWEDSGVEDPVIYSGPNHMTLGEARDMFNNRRNELPLIKWVEG